MATTKLSNVRPDFNALVEDLRSNLEAYDAWQDILPFSAGTAMVDFIAAVGTMLNYSVEKAAQESNFDTQGLDSSTYRLARSMGVGATRRYPAHVSVNLQVDSAVTSLPRFTQFQIDGVDYYNVEPITLAVGSTVVVSNVTLWQGSIEVKRYVGTGRAYQVLRFGQDFTISDHFINVRVGSVEFTRTKHPLWMAEEGEVHPYWDTTLPDGSVQLVFGNEEFGTIPEVGAQIIVTYAETLGEAGNTPESNLEVSLVDTIPGIASLSGVTRSAGDGGVPSGGKIADTAEKLRWSAPRLYAAGNRAVRRDDWEVLMTTWNEADILDTRVWGEHEARFVGNGCFGPFNMNVVHVCPLTATGTITSVEIGLDPQGNPIYVDKSNDFLNFIRTKQYVNSNPVLRTPIEVHVDLDVSVFVFTGVQVEFITTTLNTALNSLFSRRLGALGARYEITDLTNTIIGYEQVDYCIINSINLEVDGVSNLVDQIILQQPQFATLRDLALTVQTTER